MKASLFFLLAACALLPARAQTPAAEWATVCAGGPVNTSYGTPFYFFGPTTSVVDGAGNVYTVGSFTGTITLGSTTLSATQRDNYLVKLDPTGQVQWAMQLGDNQRVGINQLAVNNAGSLYLTGSFGSYSMQVGSSGPVLYNSSAKGDGFVAKLSSQSGQCLWARRFGGTGDDSGNALALSAAGEVFVAGRTGDAPADLGPFSLPAANSFALRGFLAKLSASGSWLWAQPLGSAGLLDVTNLLPDGQGSLYLTGTFYSPGLTLGATQLSVGTLSGGSDGYDGVVAKYTEGGILRWARQVNPAGTHSLQLRQTRYDGLGHLFLVGSFGSQTAKFGSFVLTTAGPLYPQPTPAPPYPNTDRYFPDAFVARYDTAGTWQWATRYGNASVDDCAWACALDGAGQLWVRYQPQTGPNLLRLANTGSGATVRDFVLPGPPPGGPGSFALLNDELGRVYVAGSFTDQSLRLGAVSVAGLGNGYSTGYVARLGSQTLATRPPQVAGSGLQAWPTPGSGIGVWVQGAKPGQEVEVFDVLGRHVGGGTMPASGPLRLSWAGSGLVPGMYVVRGGGQSCRWVVES